MKNKEYNFENFKVNKGNKLAFTASIDIVKEPGKKFTPLFISGNTLERTHLLNAIANALEESNHKVSYSINEITNDTDVLIIDELENLSNEDENKLIDIIKDYISNQKQIVLGSNTTLNKLNITEELKDNIWWGISVNIEEDSNETNNEKLEDYNWLE